MSPKESTYIEGHKIEELIPPSNFVIRSSNLII